MSSPAGDAGERRLLDTHCHLDAFPDPLAVLRAATAAGVDVVAVTEDPGSYRLLRTRLGPRTAASLALGFHPLRVGSLTPHDLARFLRLQPQVTWIGEIGLDFSPAGAPTKKQQLRAFDAILAEPIVARRPVTVHSRGAQDTVISRLARAQVPAILHWFTGSTRALHDAVEAGLWFSVNRAMTRSAKGTALLRRLPRDRVLLETDGPYCLDSGRPFAPVDLGRVVEDLALIWGEPRDYVRATICDNQDRLLARCGP